MAEVVVDFVAAVDVVVADVVVVAAAAFEES